MFLCAHLGAQKPPPSSRRPGPCGELGASQPSGIKQEAVLTALAARWTRRPIE